MRSRGARPRGGDERRDVRRERRRLGAAALVKDGGDVSHGSFFARELRAAEVELEFSGDDGEGDGDDGEAEEKVAHRLGGLPADGGAQEDAGEAHGVLAEGGGGQRVRDEKGARDRADASEHRDGREDALEVRGERHGAREARAGDADEAEIRRPTRSRGGGPTRRTTRRAWGRGVAGDGRRATARTTVACATAARARRRMRARGGPRRESTRNASERERRAAAAAKIPRILSDGFSESRRTTNSQIVLPSDDSKRQLANVCDFRRVSSHVTIQVSSECRRLSGSPRAGHSGISAISPSPVTVASPPSPRHRSQWHLRHLPVPLHLASEAR